MASTSTLLDCKSIEWDFFFQFNSKNLPFTVAQNSKTILVWFLVVTNICMASDLLLQGWSFSVRFSFFEQKLVWFGFFSLTWFFRFQVYKIKNKPVGFFKILIDFFFMIQFFLLLFFNFFNLICFFEYFAYPSSHVQVVAYRRWTRRPNTWLIDFYLEKDLCY